MFIGSFIKNILIRISGIFINSRKSRCIFYHDIHSDVRFTEMSNSVELFIEHVETIRSNGFEIVNNFINICKKKGITTIKSNITNIQSYDNIFTHTMCIAVLHHLCNEERRIKAIQELW